jgi:hypothetical protein
VLKCFGRLMVMPLLCMSLVTASFAGGEKAQPSAQAPRVAVVNLRDGSANAPAGAAQLPTLLNGRAARPAWNVAGVDYAVGYASDTILRDPSTISMAGVSVDKINHVVNVSGNDVALDGYDFSLDGGWGVSVSGGTNVTIQNSNFVVGRNGNTPIYVRPSASNVTIQNNLIDGAGTSTQILVAADGAGTTNIQYNLIKNAWGQNIVMSSDVGEENWVLQYNLIMNAGLGFNAGAHGDWIQTYNLPGKNTDSFQANYNTFVQNVPIAQGRTQGISAFSANSGPASGGVQIESFNNNTFIANNGAYVNFAIILDTSRLIGTGSIQNNCFDTTNIGSANGGGGNWSFVGNYNGPSGGPYKGTVAQSNNVNMVTGAYFNQSAVSIRRIIASPSSGSVGPGNTIILTLNFSSAVTVSGGTPTLILNNGGVATYAGGSGTAGLTFSYGVAAGSNTPSLVATAVKLNGASVKDRIGQIADLALDGIPQAGPEITSSGGAARPDRSSP